MTFQIKPAVREATPALIGLWGLPGAGKTMSALLLARGLVGPAGKFVLIDTENGRAKLHAGVAAPWDHVDFQPPFGPDRYIDVFHMVEAGGYGAVIIDSASHVWEGEGGVLDMADAGRTKDGKPLHGLLKWSRPKIAHKRMMNALLRGKCHVIFCLREKELNVQVGKGAAAEIVNRGPVAIAEKNFLYEMTFAMRLLVDTNAPERIKAPDELRDLFKPDQRLSTSTGAAIAAWLGAGAPRDERAEQVRRSARNAAAGGDASLKKHWSELSEDDRAALKPIGDDLRRIADQADREIAAEAGGRAA